MGGAQKGVTYSKGLRPEPKRECQNHVVYISDRKTTGMTCDSKSVPIVMARRLRSSLERSFWHDWQDEAKSDVGEWRKCTLSAFRRACSSSRAACFSLSSTLVKEMPVLAREETALERVLALNQGTDTENGDRPTIISWLLKNCLNTSETCTYCMYCYHWT